MLCRILLFIALIQFVERPVLARAGLCGWIMGKKKEDAQMKIWETRESGSDVLADQLRDQLENKLKTAKIKEVLGKSDFWFGMNKKKGKLGGLTRTYLVIFKDGSKAIFKPHKQDRVTVDFLTDIDPPNSISELLAYELNNLLGWNLVPTTVEREIKLPYLDSEKGILQVWVEDTKSMEDYYREERLSEFPQLTPKVFILYALMDNSDGNGPLVHSSGRMIGSDFSYGLHPTREGKYDNRIPYVYSREDRQPWSPDYKTYSDEELIAIQSREAKELIRFKLTYDDFLELERIDEAAFDRHFAGKNLPERELSVLKTNFFRFRKAWRFYYDLGYRSMVQVQ